MGNPASAGIDVGTRVVTTQPLPEGIGAGESGTVVGAAGWIQRRWRVEFDDGRCVSVPEYALDPHPSPGRFSRG
jgi:hypothetical protein